MLKKAFYTNLETHWSHSLETALPGQLQAQGFALGLYAAAAVVQTHPKAPHSVLAASSE